jgi:hypothetical protein
MYSVNGQQFEGFTKAVAAAKAIRADVIEVATGLRRWTPGTVSAASQRRYEERLSAYAAQQRLDAMKEQERASRKTR